MTATTRRPFDLLDPLPRGRLAIEASAGTGKTFTLAALATRYLAETDLTTSDLLIVTFTRAATTELRARVRARVAGAAAHLAGTPGAPAPDLLLDHLAATDRERRAERLARAVTEFDAAAISTIHGFAGQVLATLGSAGQAEPDLALVSDDHQLAWDLGADVLARAATQGHDPDDLPKLPTLVGLVKVQANTPDLLVLPAADEPAASAAQRLLRQLVAEVGEAMDAHRRRVGTRSYGDLLVDLRQALHRDGRVAEAAATLRARHRVALIDEFQDTDPVQWDIFRTVFLDELPGQPPEVDREGALVLVGDPKQAIYAFRGANVHTYVDAVASGGHIATLGTNWRSDGAVLQGLELLLEGTTYGDAGIAFTPVAPAPDHVHRRAHDDRGTPLPALSLRLALGDGIKRTKAGPFYVDEVDRAVYADLVAHARWLLDHGRLPHDGAARPVRPSDLTVLVKRGEEASAVQAALIDHGIPAVLARGGSVLRSPAATQWRWVLEALARPSDPARARTFALSWFGGASAAWVDAATDAELDEVQDRLHRWADGLARQGVHELVRLLWAETDVVTTVLGRPDGDRSMTDLDHVAELLRTESVGRGSVAGLLAVLDSSPELDPDAEMEGDLASRRVESEAEAVQIMTVWVAKGLEFPIALCPTLWRKRTGDVVFQDEAAGRRALDVAKGADWPDKAAAAARKRLAAAEQEGEDLRLLYVALTRAKHQVVVWWSRVSGNDSSALSRVLFARDAAGHIDPAAYAEAKVAVHDLPGPATDALAPLAARGGDAVEVRVVDAAGPPGAPWVDPVAAAVAAPLQAATLDRPLDRRRNRWSFTAITSRADHAGPPGTAAPEERPGGADEGRAVVDDGELFTDDGGGLAAPPPAPQPEGGPTDELDAEPALAPAPDGPGGQLSLFEASATSSAPAEATRPGAASPLAGLPAGAAFGTLVHGILEHLDFAAPDLAPALALAADAELAWRSLDLSPVGAAAVAGPDGSAAAAIGRAALEDGLAAALATPLGPLADGRTLRSLERVDRLDELAFDLVLGEGGSVPTDRDLGALVLEHLAPGDPYRPWAQQVAAGAFDVDLAGHLTGSIDLVLRLARPHAPPRFVVVDYKTNRLHDPGGPPGPADYHPDRLVAAMVEHHYPLQALLYAVALHRYLRWRLPAYDPATNLGGAAYLFLRGMSGPQVADAADAPHGVAAWPIPPELVVALSDLLHGRARATSSAPVAPVGVAP